MVKANKNQIHTYPLEEYQQSAINILPNWTEESDDFLKLENIIAILRRRWLILIATMTLTASPIIYYVFTQPPIYSQKFHLLMEVGNANSLYNPLGEGMRIPFIPLNFRDFATEIEVLTSYELISPLLPEIQKRYPELNYQKIVSALSIINLNGTAVIAVSYQDTDPEKIKFILEILAEKYREYSLKKVTSATDSTQELVENQLPLINNRVERLQRQIQVFRQANNIINPEEQGVALSQALANILEQQKQTQTAIEVATSKYNSLQRQLQMNLNQAVIVESLNESPRYITLNAKLQELEAELILARSKFYYTHPTIRNLEEKKQGLQLAIDTEKRKILGNDFSTNVNSVQEPVQKSQIRTQLTQDLVNLNIEIQGLQTQKQSLLKLESEARRDIQDFASLVKQYTDLQLQLTISNESLKRFLTARENIQIKSASEVAPWRVISNITTPTVPILPNKNRGIIQGIIAGLFIGLGAVFITEKLDNKYHSSSELEQDLSLNKLAKLGNIPYEKQLLTTQTQLVNDEIYQHSVYWESYVSLQSNLDFIEPDNPLKSIVISSPLPGDGKSTVAFNLAQSIALMGKKVLLVDADLRRPTLHQKISGITNIWGLSNLLSSNSPIEKLIQSFPVNSGENHHHQESNGNNHQIVFNTLPKNDNLYILTAGQTPPNPAKLLSSQKMVDLIRQWEQTFDTIIFDTPPLTGITDAKLLATHTDGLILVVGIDKTDRDCLNQVVNDLRHGQRSNQINLLGVVANGGKRNSGYGKYYYQYYQRE